MNKRFIDANELLADSFRLAAGIFSSGYLPDLIVGVWRGGTPVAIAVHEYFSYKGWEPDHIAIRALSYTGINERTKEVKLAGLEYLYSNFETFKQILIVDDVFDTGNSFKTIINTLVKNCGPSARQRIRIACPWYKPENNQTDLTPDFYLHETGEWLVFPHELAGLTEEEIRNDKKGLYEIIHNK